MITIARAATVLDPPSELHWVGQLARVEVWVFLSCLVALVGLRLLDGRINTRGMLSNRESDLKAGLSPARVQLLVVTLLAACGVLLNIGAMRQSHRLELGSGLNVVLLGGSSTLLLARDYLLRRRVT